MSGLKRLYIAIVTVLFSTVLIGTFFPMRFHLTIKNSMEWVFQTFPIGWIIGIGILLFTAIIVVGGVLYFGQQARLWYIRRQGPNYRKYDDPDFRN